MKRFIIIAIAAVAVAAMPAVARSQALIIHGEACFVPGVLADGSVTLSPSLGSVAMGPGVMKVENDNQVTVLCTTNVTNLSGKTVVIENLLCFIHFPSGPYMFATESRLTVAKNGQAVLKCTYTKP